MSAKNFKLNTEQFINYVNEHKISDTRSFREIEARISVNKSSVYFNTFLNHLSNIHHNDNTYKCSVNTISNESVKSVFLNDINDVKKTEYYKKEKKAIAFIKLNKLKKMQVKLALSVETNCEPLKKSQLKNFDCIRIKFRKTFQLNDWQLDVTTAKEIYPTDNDFVMNNKRPKKDKLSRSAFTLKKLKELTNNISNFNNPNEEEFIDLCRVCGRIEFEWEYKPAILTNESLSNLIENDILSIFKNVISLNIINKPIELTKTHFNNEFKQKLSQGDEFFITNKLDGKRVILVWDIFNEETPTNLYAVDSKHYKHTVAKYNLTEESNYLFHDNYDCEYTINENGNPEYYIFDLIYSKTGVHSLGLDERLSYLQSLDFINENECIFVKDFKKCNINYLKHDIVSDIKSYFSDNSNDGVIFSSVDESYAQTDHYKYKPRTKLSIDFMLVKKANSNNIYECYSSISNGLKNKIVSDKLIYIVNIPHIPFKPTFRSNSNGKYDHFVLYDGDENISHRIAECVYMGNNRWKILKFRDDKFYANKFSTADKIFDNCTNYLSIENFDLFNDNNVVNNKYFKSDNKHKQKNIRSFNNTVKSQLISLLLENKKNTTVVDFCSGNGQDLYKYMQNDCNQINLIELDRDAISNIVERKHTYLYDRRLTGKYKIHVDQIDLSFINCLGLQSSLKELKKNYGGTDLIVCNFAIHYLLNNLTELFDYMKILLRSTGKVLITYLDGKMVTNLLKKYSGEFKYNDLHLKSHQDTKKFYIKLPFTNNEFVEESKVYNHFLKRKQFKVVKSDSFSTFTDKNDWNKKEYEYLSVFKYLILSHYN